MRRQGRRRARRAGQARPPSANRQGDAYPGRVQGAADRPRGLADKAYPPRHRARAVGGHRGDRRTSDQTGHRNARAKGGRPPAFDAEAYKGRNVIERSFNVLKQWRGLATRYDKLALTYRGGVVLGAITAGYANGRHA